MKRVWMAVVACCGFALAGAPARAGEESPRSFAMELRLGLYQPSIDGEFDGGATPFRDIFRDDSAWMFGGELDYQFFQGFGSLGVFGMMHYGRLSGKALEADGERSADRTRMILLPMTAGLVYRFDVFSRRWGIPLVPAFKFGATHTLWWVRDGVDDKASYTDEDGKRFDGAGGTWGLYGSAGLFLMLNIFEPHTAKTFDNELGVNGSYLFIEYVYQWVNDFGSDKSFDLSDGGVYFGLAFEM